MIAMRFVRAAALAAVACTTACTIGPLTGDDAGADGSSSAPITASVGDRCESVSTALCNKAAMCQALATSLTECVSDYKLQCCTGSECDKTSTSSDLVVSTCTQAIMTEDCNDLVNGNLPTYCSSFKHN